MTHVEFLAGYREGKIRVNIDRSGAARVLSERLLLPFVLLPVLGLGVALALSGYLFSGAAVFVGGLAFRFLVRSSSQGFVLNRALRDPDFYEEMKKKKVLLVTILAP